MFYENDYYYFIAEKLDDKYCVKYVNELGDFLKSENIFFMFNDHIEANARAKMLIYLIENNLINA